MKNIRLIIRDTLPDYFEDNEENTVYILWSDRVNKDDLIISVPLELERQGDLIRSEFLDLIYEYSFKKINGKYLVDYFDINRNNYWWSSLFIETDNVYQSPHYNDILKILILEKILSKYPLVKNLRIDLKNKKIKKILHKRYFKNRKRFNYFNLIFLKNLIYHIIKGFLTFNKLIFCMLRYKDIINFNKNNIKSNSKILFNHFSSSQIKNNKFNSKYWGDLPNLINERHDLVWLNMLHSDFKKSKVIDINKFINNNCFNQHHIFIESKLNFKLIIKSFFEWLILIFNYIRVHNTFKLIRFNNLCIWDIIETDIYKSFLSSKAVFNILYANLFNEVLSTIPLKSELYILYEGQGWESLLINNWKQKIKSSVYLVSHDAKRYWDMRYQYSAKMFKNKYFNNFPIADLYISHGNYASENMANFIPENKIYRAEALRFNNLKIIKKYKINKPYKILILSSASFSLTNTLLNISNQFLKKYPGEFNFLFKPHPDTIIQNFNYENIRLLDPKVLLSDIVKSADLVFTSASTSAALDAYLTGINVITLLDKSLPNISPLYNCNGIKYCYDFQGFESIVLNIDFRSSSLNSKNKEYFYTSQGLLLWKKLLGI